MLQTQASRAAATDAGLAAHMNQIFSYMSGGVALSGIVSYFTATNAALFQAAASGGTQILFFIIWMAFAFFMNTIITRMSPKMALGVFAAFSALTGFALTPMVMMYTGASIFNAFFVAVFMFGGAALYGNFSKKSLSGWGNFLMLGAWGLIGAIVVNLIAALFFGGPIQGLSFVISLIAVPLFAGITAWETNMLRDQYQYLKHDEITRSSTAIYGAASLYMNFVIMFIHLLQLLGQRR